MQDGLSITNILHFYIIYIYYIITVYLLDVTTCGRHATTVVCVRPDPRLPAVFCYCRIAIVTLTLSTITMTSPLSTLPHTATTRATVMSCLQKPG